MKLHKMYHNAEIADSSYIQFKSFPVERFNSNNYKINEVQRFSPNKHGWISDNLLAKIKQPDVFDREETVIVNFGVGKGKTYTAHRLILEYAKQEDTLVIVASPYKSLVDRDYSKLSRLNTENNTGLQVMNYIQVTKEKDEAFDKLIKSDIHVMTINCLLQNPGETALEQNIYKRNYLKSLHERCIKEDLKVVIVFDEIHDSIVNFKKDEFILNLLHWEPVVKKVFTLSATYTEASFVVLSYISLLTQATISVYDSDRIKKPERATLYFHLLPYSYEHDLSVLSPLKTIAKDALDKGKCKSSA